MGVNGITGQRKPLPALRSRPSSRGHLGVFVCKHQAPRSAPPPAETPPRVTQIRLNASAKHPLGKAYPHGRYTGRHLPPQIASPPPNKQQNYSVAWCAGQRYLGTLFQTTKHLHAAALKQRRGYSGVQRKQCGTWNAPPNTHTHTPLCC
jgi:hypothetical protein